jgi:hypothetical protein
MIGSSAEINSYHADFDRNLVVTGGNLKFKDTKESSMRSRRPRPIGRGLEGDDIVRFIEAINRLPTYHLSGSLLARVRAIPRDIRHLRHV